MSIVKRLGGSGGAKLRHLFGLCKDFEEKVCKVSAKKQVYSFFFAEPKPFLCKKCGNGGGLWSVHLCLLILLFSTTDGTDRTDLNPLNLLNLYLGARQKHQKTPCDRCKMSLTSH